MTYHPLAHFDDCRSSICEGCYDDPLADLGVAARAALVEKAKAIPVKTFELDPPTTPSPERVTLTDEEYGLIDGTMADASGSVLPMAMRRIVERILTAREQALREEIAEQSVRAALGTSESPEMTIAMLLDAADRLENPGHRGNWHSWPKHAKMLRNLAAAVRGETR